MKHATWLVAVFASSMFGATMSHEEAVVRQTYAKIAYANDVYNIHKQIDNYNMKGLDPSQMPMAQALAEVQGKHIHFTLAEFKVGNIVDIKGKYEDYLSQPDGKNVLSVAPDGESDTENGKTVEDVEAQIQWQQGQLHTSADWSFPAVSRLTKPVDGTVYQRYAAYRVIVKFEGQERDYHAFALFTTGQPQEKVFFADLITGNSALNFFVNADVTPKTLTETSLRTNPIAVEWLRKNNQPPVNPTIITRR